MYALLVERVSAMSLSLSGRPCAAERAAKLTSLFSPQLRVALAPLLEGGGRWPQEAVTESDLRDVLDRSSWRSS
jgi:hypothetical protein